MPKYSLTNLAVQDLEDIWNYTFVTWSEPQADKYYSDLTNAFDSILSNPALFGKDYGFIAEGLYGFRCNKHIIFYTIDKEFNIIIVRILHESMNHIRHI